MELWDAEPDWLGFDAAGFECMVVRHSPLNNLWGYVCVGPAHPCFGQRHQDIDVDVHGGLTLSHNRCPVARENDTPDWWLGFDCAHLGDLRPGLVDPLGADPDERYRDIGYVMNETVKLAVQLAAMQEETPDE